MENNMKLIKKIALITGGSQGIGKAIAQRFLEEGAKVIVFDIQKPDYKVDFYQVDITKEEQIKKAFGKIKHLDIIVNNAGIYFQASIEDTTQEELDKIVDVNLKGTYLICKYALPLIRKSRRSFSSEEAIQNYAKLNPMKRIGKPQDVANVAAFLASDEASYITGGLYSVDGGESTSSIYSK